MESSGKEGGGEATDREIIGVCDRDCLCRQLRDHRFGQRGHGFVAGDVVSVRGRSPVQSCGPANCKAGRATVYRFVRVGTRVVALPECLLNHDCPMRGPARRLPRVAQTRPSPCGERASGLESSPRQSRRQSRRGSRDSRDGGASEAALVRVTVRPVRGRRRHHHHQRRQLGDWVESERTIVPRVCVLRPRLAAALADFLQSQIAACTLSDEKERLKSLFHKNDTD